MRTYLANRISDTIFFDYYDNVAFLETSLGITNNVVNATSESTFKVSNESTTERQTMTHDHMENDNDSSGNVFSPFQYVVISVLNEHTACITYFATYQEKIN